MWCWFEDALDAVEESMEKYRRCAEQRVSRRTPSQVLPQKEVYKIRVGLAVATYLVPVIERFRWNNGCVLTTGVAVNVLHGIDAVVKEVVNDFGNMSLMDRIFYERLLELRRVIVNFTKKE